MTAPGSQSVASRFRETLHELVEVNAATGDTFYRTLVTNLGRVLRVKFAFIGLFEGAIAGGAGAGAFARVRTTAFAVDGCIVDNTVYELADTPCANVVERGLCFYRAGVAPQFPHDSMLKDLCIESYLGVPLRGLGNTPLGLLVVMHDGPIDETLDPASILQIFASRTVAELERQRADLAARLAEQRARGAEQRERYRRVLDRLPIPVSTSTRDGRRDYANPAYLRVMGYTLQEAPTVPAVMALYLPDPEVLAATSAAMASQRELCRRGEAEVIVVPKVTVRTKSGEIRIVDVTQFEDGEMAVTIFVDVTERVRGERALIESNRRLEDANRELEAFSYTVSHDLRAPLRHIDGIGLMLQEDCGASLDEVGRDYVDRMRGAARRMAALIDGLLKLSKVSRADLTLREVDVSQLAREIVAELSANDPTRVVEVVIAPGITARADATLARVALANLLDNAWKYTGKVAHPRIELGPAARGSAFYVRDNGAGFDMALSERLFGPFQRLHDAAEFAGTGIGLATVKRIVDRHGGTLVAEAAVGAGATFRMSFAPPAPVPVLDGVD